MRWTALIALAIFLPGAPSLAQMSDDDSAQPLIYQPNPVALSSNSPTTDAEEGPSDAEVGPVQKHFVMASQTDDLAETQVQDNASQAIHEKIALDKRIKVPLIHDVENNGMGIGHGNHAMNYEITYLNWGAVTNRQLAARRGHYFTITWANDGPPGDFTARFEYRQVKSKEIVRTLSQNMSHISGGTRSYFAVVNKAYYAYGPVCSWRFTILKGDTVVAQAKSFIW